MTENEFYMMVKDNIPNYLPKEYLDSEITLEQVTKNNDSVMTGLAVRKPGEDGAPLIYLTDIYEDFLEGTSIHDICEAIARNVCRYDNLGFSISDIDLSYEAIRDKLRIKAINSDANEQLLTGVISRDAGCGYSLVAYMDVDIGIDPNFGGTIQITRDMAALFDYSDRQVIHDAVMGSLQYGGARLNRIQDVVMFRSPCTDLLTQDPGDNQPAGPMVLTNSDGVLGASVLFLPGIKEKVAETVGGSYYVLPSSIHEFLIIPEDENTNPQDLAEMVKRVNESMVAPEEQMGNRVLRYDAETKSLDIAADMDRDVERGEER